ncbi:MAG: hypothetical protein IJ088_09560 [Clostridia bacterium]|nr:hypothetical protein [Clostridia bacterium]
MAREVLRTQETLQFTAKDYRSGSVGFYQHDLDHLKEHHPDMVSHMDAVIDTIEDPDIVSYDLTEFATPYSQHFYKQTTLLLNCLEFCSPSSNGSLNC